MDDLTTKLADALRLVADQAWMATRERDQVLWKRQQPMFEAAREALRLYDAAKAATPAPAPQWQPIETAPKDGSVIVLSRGQQAFAGYWGEGQYTTGWLASGSTLVMAFNNINPPTHWMPLPHPPKENKHD